MTTEKLISMGRVIVDIVESNPNKFNSERIATSIGHSQQEVIRGVSAWNNSTLSMDTIKQIVVTYEGKYVVKNYNKLSETIKGYGFVPEENLDGSLRYDFNEEEYIILCQEQYEEEQAMQEEAEWVNAIPIPFKKFNELVFDNELTYFEGSDELDEGWLYTSFEGNKYKTNKDGKDLEYAKEI